MLIQKTCTNCGKKFTTQQCWVDRNRGDGKYCSRQCKTDYHKGKPAKKWNSAEFICKQCGKIMVVPRCRLKRNPTFCSYKCQRQYWDLTSLIRLKRKSLTQKEGYNSIVYQEWRNRIFQRDKYTCRWCNAHSGNGKDIYLEAHHIKSWKEYPELRFDLENGLTLCQDCHNTTRGNYANFKGGKQ